jgi:BNR repeat-like domain
MMRMKHRWVIAAAALGLAALGMRGLGARPQGAKAQFEPEQLLGTVSQTNWEPTTAADPGSTWVYQLTSDQIHYHINFRASSDGGKTWSAQRDICQGQKPVQWQYDPQIQVARDGAIYAACLDTFNPGVAFTKSSDHGTTWSTAITVDGNLGYSDKPVLLISPSGADVYLGFNDGYGFYVAISHDFGTTFAPPLKATTERRWYYSSQGAVAPDGSVYFAVTGESSVHHSSNENGPIRIELLRSGDGGQTWATTYFNTSQEGEPCEGPNCYPDFFAAQSAIAIDFAGHVLYAYTINDEHQGPNSLYLRASDDGIHFSEPRLVNNLGNSTSPLVAAGPAPGDFRLVWQDNRIGEKSWNTWYARTTDGGGTWSEAVRLSNLGAVTRYKNADGYEFPFGDYLGLAVNSAGENFVIWGEGTGIYIGGGTWYTRGQ